MDQFGISLQSMLEDAMMEAGGQMFYGSIIFILQSMMTNVYLTHGSFLAMFN